jgi:hypothetical protein
MPLLIVAVALTAATLHPAFADRAPVHAAKTCSDYKNQRDAQLHKDTRDADGDGIYCESLPCPCLKPGGGTKPPPSSSPPTGQGPALFNGRCKRGRLPDYGCTPGAVFKNVTTAQVCEPGYSKGVRNVSESLKRKVYLSYGIRRHKPYEYEVDHLVSLELGGNNSQRNLWPEKQPAAKDKDKIENSLHRQVCDASITLKRAQSQIKHWNRVGAAQGSVRSDRVIEFDAKGVRSSGGFEPQRNPGVRAATKALVGRAASGWLWESRSVVCDGVAWVCGSTSQTSGQAAPVGMGPSTRRPRRETAGRRKRGLRLATQRSAYVRYTRTRQSITGASGGSPSARRRSEDVVSRTGVPF